MKKQLILFVFTTMLLNIYAQKVRVIDNKGTKITVRNNQVTTSNITPINPVENDVWFDTSTTPKTIKVFDDLSGWVVLTHTATTGSVFFASTNGSPTENVNQLFWDNNNNRLGVGTGSPTNKLEVSGAMRSQGILNSNGTVNEPSYRFSNDTNTGMYRPAADELGFVVGAFEAIHIDETTIGSTKVTINQTLELNGQILDENNTVGTTGQVLTATSTGTKWLDSSTIDTDDQKIDEFTLNTDGKNLELSLESDTEITKQTDLSALKLEGDVTGTLAINKVEKIQNITVSETMPTDGQVLVYNGSSSQWETSATVYSGFFIIDAPNGTTATTYTKSITGLPFKPSQITFVANTNIESLNIDDNNSSGKNARGLNNSYGTMNGFARLIGTTKTQQTIYIGGHGNSINDISRYASSSNCIGLRYGDQDGLDLGKIIASLNTFDSNGFTLNISYTLGTVTNLLPTDLILNIDPTDILKESVVILYTAYR